MITSRFNTQIPYYLIIASILSFATSLFFMQLFLGILSIFWLCEKIENKKKAFDKIGIMILIFGGVRILSIFFSDFFSVSIESFYKEALFYFAFFSLTFYLKIFDEKKIIFISGFFVISTAITALSGIILFNLSLVERATSFSSGGTVFSSVLLAGFGFGLFFISKEVKFFWKYKTLINSIILTGIITSLGRTNIAITALFFISALLLKKININSAVVILFLTLFFSSVSFYNNNIMFIQRVEQPTQPSDRDIIYKGAKEIMFEHPFLGYGPRTFKEVFPFPDQFADKGVGGWHNDILQIYFESGLLGLISFIALLYFIIYCIIKMLRRKIKEEISGILYGILFSICGFILSSITAGFITSVVISIVFVFIVSILSSIVHNTKTEEPQENI